ncbi:glucose PTS transporter subunit IIA [Corynebacterium alimapuense]|uniref:PTS beta-glucoside transporter subunit IIABC n=1 Tax=Corynebacterium alimapuense TaxID=1576874 RepID=A0A3M8K6S7_9CORY|nr:PTS glucose transporter subunit IIABC [Corynebacterium alimapuense]RNE48917.1 PTS beta-glucoside transporter subunit IIABC [Corynebacterium alimapuense]
MTSTPALTVLAPIAGTVIPIEEVPDPVFARKTMGEGFGILDTPGGEVVSPVTGKVVMVAKTGHAIGFKTEEGLQFLLHLGIDTVELEGAPFEINVAKGDLVTAGDRIATMDIAAILEAGKSTATVVIVTNTKKKLDHLDVDEGAAALGAEVARAYPLVADPAAAPAASPESASKAEGDSTVAVVQETEVASQRPTDLSGFDALAWEIIDGIGGASNVRSVTHCITRVRFYLKDESKAQDDYVADLEGVIDVVKAGGQYQVVIGADVEDVYEAVSNQLGGGVEDDDPGEAREKPTTAFGWVKYGFSELIGVITGSMIPVIGLLAASGIIKGILSLLLTFDVITDTSDTFQIINAMSDAVFFFLPIFVGFTAAKRLGADPIIVAIIGGVLVYPTLVEMSATEGTSSIMGMSLNSEFFGIPLHMPSYSYSIFPIIVAAWLASRIEPWLKRVIPNMVRMIFLPLAEVVIVSLAILLVLGPIVMFVSTGIASLIQGLYDLSPTISGTVIGGLYQSLVIFGLHWAVIPLVAQDIAASGNSYLNAIISATMVAQGGAVLAVFVKTRIEKVKTLSGPAAISAFCGITEPAMYGVNLKYGRVFIMASIGGALGGLLTGLLNVNMWGFTGSLIGFTSFVNPEGLDSSFWGFLIASSVSLGVAFTLTWFFGFKDSDVETVREVKKVRLGSREPAQK